MSPQRHPSEQTLDRVERFIDDRLVDGGVPGMSLAIVTEDGHRYSKGFGARDLSENAPMTSDTLYGIGSCTKSFTALGIMRLAEQGALDVSDPVTEYLPVYEHVPGDPITVHDLLCHGSGMPSDATAVALITRHVTGKSSTTPLSSADDFRRHVESSLDTRVTDESDPFYYYNSGYTVLGEVIEAVSGTEYREYVRKNVLDPLGMDRSTFDGEAFDGTDDAMSGYYRDDDDLIEGGVPHDRVIDAPGGLLSSVDEMGRYLRMQMNGGTLDGERLVSEDAVATMHEPYTTRETRLDGTEVEYGYGWMLREFLDDRLVEHGGTVTVSTGYVGFLEEAGIGVAIGANATPEVHPMYVGPAVLAILSGRRPSAVPFFALREKVDRIAGVYESHRGLVEAEVEPAGGTATLSMLDREFSLHPTSTDPDDLTFETVTAAGAREPVEFGPTGEGGVDLRFQRWRLQRADTRLEPDHHG
ncbi:serine hydrolase [Halorubrum rubrum]|uniref:Serine hydrolase n=1 Tax=Halorubrum rubrum TaxID=1126240 RepID=A0ABD5R414_9EURY|nr:serine hydrolase [Halorubrum rubrum]